MEHKETNHLETDFSGNGLMEPGPRLQPMGRHGKEYTQDGGFKEHASKDRLHLPVYSDVDSIHPVINVSIRKQPVNSRSVKQMMNKVGENHKQERFPSTEGSASLPLSFD